MQSSTGQGATGSTGTLPRVADLYDPTRTFEVRSRDVVYRRDGSVEWLALQHLEGDLVDVDGVGVGGEVVQLPHLGRAHGRALGDLVVPPQ